MSDFASTQEKILASQKAVFDDWASAFNFTFTDSNQVWIMGPYFGRHVDTFM